MRFRSIHDTQLNTTTRISVATNGAQSNDRYLDAHECFLRPSISADGRYITFQSDATNLVPGDTNDETDVFVRDTVAGTTARISVSAFSPSISADGRYITFLSYSSNLVPGDSDTDEYDDVFVRGPLF